MFYSKKVLKKSGVTVPKTWGELLQDMPKIAKAGFTPLALGGESWQERMLFMSIALGEGGKPWFDDTFIKGHIKNLNDKTGHKVLTIFRKLNKYVGKGSVGRNWNDTTNLIVQDKAGFQFMGDWVKAEFKSAHKIAGKDYGCRMAPGEEVFMGQIDNFIAPKNGNQKAQDAFITSATSAKVQAKFSTYKGSIPIRKDTDISDKDMCVKYAYKLLQNSKNQTLNPTQVMSSDAMGGLMDAITNYWNDSSISVKDGADSMVSAVLEAN